MDIAVSRQEAVRVVTLSGRLDLTAADHLEERLRSECESGGRWFIMDLRRLESVTSRGLGVFVALNRRLGGAGGVRFAGLFPPVKRVFDLTGLSLHFGLYRDADAALSDFPPPASGGDPAAPDGAPPGGAGAAEMPPAKD